MLLELGWQLISKVAGFGNGRHDDPTVSAAVITTSEHEHGIMEVLAKTDEGDGLSELQSLLEKATDDAQREDLLRAYLHDAVTSGDLRTMEVLVSEGAPIEAMNHDHETPLLSAAKSGKVELVRWLIQKGAKIEAADTDGYRSLHWAANHGHKAIVAFLLKRNAELNAITDKMETPLHLAANNGHLPVVMQLVQAGADAGALDGGGQKPMDLAKARGHKEIASYLRKAYLKAAAIVDRADLVPLNRDGTPATGRFPVALGRGAFGQVFEASYRKTNYAFKELNSPYEFRREKAIITDLSHPHVMALRHIVVVANEDGREVGYLMDKAHEDLLSFITNSSGNQDLLLVARLAKEIADGLNYLHSQGVIHRDLHMKNVLMMGEKALISDFNCGVRVGGRSFMTGYAGMMAVVPPEYRDMKEVKEDPLFDMYGYGLLVAQLVLAVTSQQGDTSWRELEDGLAGLAIAACAAIGSEVSTRLQAVINKCVSGEVPRPTAAKVLSMLA